MLSVTLRDPQFLPMNKKSNKNIEYLILNININLSKISNCISEYGNNSIRRHLWHKSARTHSHVHAVVTEGVFTDSGHFVHIGETWKHRAVEIWQDKIFELLLDKKKIDQETVAGMRTWRHSGFPEVPMGISLCSTVSTNSVRIEASCCNAGD